jgi:hypothetical protein
LLLRTPDKSEQNERRPRTSEANKRIVRLLLLSAQYLDDLSTNCPRVLPLKPVLDMKQVRIPVLLGLLPAGSKELGLIVEKEISPPFILRTLYLFSNLTKKHI